MNVKIIKRTLFYLDVCVCVSMYVWLVINLLIIIVFIKYVCDKIEVFHAFSATGF